MKAKKQEEPVADIGIIVGRFQVDKLHDGHKQLFQHVAKTHDNRVMIFLGIPPTKGTQNNPLNYQARRQMIVEDFPELSDHIHYIKDTRYNEVWSRKLDEQIESLTNPGDSVMLYGSRESFIRGYHGKHPCTEMEQDHFISGTERRRRISKDTLPSQPFRAGAIWALNNQFPGVYMTVDIAIFDDNGRLLLAKKPGEKQLRFVGGFVEGTGNLQQNARREVHEETGLEIGDIEMVDSFVVKDWRYRNEKQKILTVLFKAKRIYGNPSPNDDIDEVEWVQLEELKPEQVVPEHIPLVEALIENMKSE